MTGREARGGAHRSRRRKIGLPRQRKAAAAADLADAEAAVERADAALADQQRKLAAEQPLRRKLAETLPQANHLAALVEHIISE